MNQQMLKSLLISTLVVGAVAFGSSVNIPHTFTPGTTAYSSDVNANFTAIKTAVDDNDARITALQATPVWININPSGGASVAFENGFLNYNSATHQPCAYFKDTSGFVRMRGLFKRAGAALGTNVFVLPPDYRPAKNTNFVVVANNKFARVEIDIYGTVRVIAADDPNWFSFVSLDGINFDTR